MAHMKLFTSHALFILYLILFGWKIIFKYLCVFLVHEEWFFLFELMGIFHHQKVDEINDLAMGNGDNDFEIV